jgi:phage replication-related protein YjqB (UPF0714/DUF867 family)
VSFARLLAEPGVVEVAEQRGRFGFMAFHGGGLEEMTDVIAAAAAARSGSSLYAVLQPPELQWHIPSADVDPAASDLLRAFLDHVDVVVTLHGYFRVGCWASLLAGGGNRALAEHVAGALRPALPVYDVVTDLERIPPELRGLHPRNPVNLPAAGGVQIELPPRVRGASPLWWDWDGDGLVPHTDALVEALAEAARSWC